jgi:hypothetical protein
MKTKDVPALYCLPLFLDLLYQYPPNLIHLNDDASSLLLFWNDRARDGSFSEVDVKYK